MGEIAHVFGIDWKLIIIQAINFGLLLFILSRFLYKPIMKMVDERRSVIVAGLNNAKDAEAKLKAADEQVHVLKDQGQKEVNELRSLALREAEKLKEKAHLDSEEARQIILKEAEKDAAAVKEKAIRDAKDEIATLAVLAAEKALQAK